MDEETKLLYSSIELDKIDINSPLLCCFNNFNDLINELYKRYDFFEKTNILKYSNNMSIDLNINNLNKGKSHNNIDSNKEYYICKVKGHSTGFCKFDFLNKESNNYKNNSFNNKNNYKNHNNNNNIKFNLKRNNNNYHSSNINEDNYNYSNDDNISDNSMNIMMRMILRMKHILILLVVSQ